MNFYITGFNTCIFRGYVHEFVYVTFALEATDAALMYNVLLNNGHNGVHIRQ